MELYESTYQFEKRIQKQQRKATTSEAPEGDGDDDGGASEQKEGTANVMTMRQ